MRRLVLALPFVLPIAACSTNSERAVEISQHGSRVVEEEAVPLPADYFSLQSTCLAEWAAVMTDWREAGGGVKDSIASTRQQISSDERSKFAAFVRGVWALQGSQNARKPEDLGAWPIGDDESRRLAAVVSFPPDLGISENCQALDWLAGFLWDEIVMANGEQFQVRKLAEAPPAVEWTSPYAQQWMKYWLLVRID